MKLSKAQEKVMTMAKSDIDRARNMDYPEWLKDQNSIYEERDDLFQEAIQKEYLKKYWENERNGIVLTSCSSQTIRKLEKLGLIEIIKDSANERFGLDHVKILNY